MRSAQGDAVAWLLNDTFDVVASNDDADATTSDSHITAALGRDGTHYIVFRDYDLASHYFTVTVALGQARGDLDNHVKQVPPSDPTIQALLPSESDFVNAVIGDSASNPSAYLEFNLHVVAEECSQDGHVRVDTRTGRVLIVRLHGC